MPKVGTPISFRAIPNVNNHLQKLGNMTEFINKCIQDKIIQSKNKVEMLRQYRKERIRVARRITQLTTTIDSIESQLTEEELEGSNTDQEKQTILQEMKKEDLVSFLEETIT